MTAPGKSRTGELDRGRIIYIVSRFPKVTETFIANEWAAVSRRFSTDMAALIRSRELPVHAQSARMLPMVRFVPLLRMATPAAHFFWMKHRPAAYFGALFDVIKAGARKSPIEVAKGLVVFVKSAVVARLVLELKVGHVHAHFANHPATAAWIVHRLSGLPYSFTAHANDLFVIPALLENKVEEAEFVATISDFNRSFLEERVPAAKGIEVIHCGVDANGFRPAHGPRPTRRRLICVASLETKKGHAYLLDALARLAQDFPDVQLDLVGDGPERRNILRRARHLGVQSRVRMLGSLPAEEVREALARADVFALASVQLASGRMEGIPVALMEAMASGVPVVAADLSGIAELITDGLTGLLVPPRNPPRLAAAIRRLIQDDSLVEQLVLQGREHVLRHFDVETEAQRLGDLFERSLIHQDALPPRRA